MFLFKKIDPEDVLYILAENIGKILPQEVKDSDAELNLTFCEDHSIEVYLTNLPDGIEGEVLN